MYTEQCCQNTAHAHTEHTFTTQTCTQHAMDAWIVCLAFRMERIRHDFRKTHGSQTERQCKDDNDKIELAKHLSDWAVERFVEQLDLRYHSTA